MTPLEIDVTEVKRRLDAGESIALIDVREAWEFSTAAIWGSQLIPMRSIPSALPRLEAESKRAELVLLCHHGVRSLQVTEWLREQGIANCSSMKGGIDAWSTRIDPAIPRY